MPGTPISGLPDASIPLTGNELLAVVQAGVTSKTRLASVGGGVGNDTYTPAPPALELVDWMPSKPTAGTWRVFLDGTSPFAVLYSIHPSLSVGGRRVRLMHATTNGLGSIIIAYNGQKPGFPDQGTPEGRLLPADSLARETVRAYSSVDLEYDGTEQRWRVIRTRHITTVERSVWEHGGMPLPVDPTQLIVCDDSTGLKCEAYPNPGSPQVRLFIDPSAFPPPPPPPPPPPLALAVADDRGDLSDYSTTLTVHDSASVTATVGGTAGAPELTLAAGGDATYTSIVVEDITVTNLNVTGAATIPLGTGDTHGHSEPHTTSITFTPGVQTDAVETLGADGAVSVAVNYRFSGARIGPPASAVVGTDDGSVTFATVGEFNYDTDGYIGSDSKTLTCPFAGAYRFTACLGFSQRCTEQRVWLGTTDLLGDFLTIIAMSRSEVADSGGTTTPKVNGFYCVTADVLMPAAKPVRCFAAATDPDDPFDSVNTGIGHFSAEYLGPAPAPPPPPTPTVLLRDAFVDADGTLLVDHVMDVGPGWTVASDSPPPMDAVIGVSPASAVMTPQTLTNDVAVSDAGTADAVVSAPMSFTDPAGDGGLCFRFQDLSNFWLFQLSFGPQTAEVYKRVGGGFALVASDTMTLTTGTTYTLTVRCVGDDVTASVSGGPTLTFIDADLDTATSWGFFFGAGGSGSPAFAYGFEVDSP